MIPVRVKTSKRFIVFVLILAFILSPAVLYARYNVTCKSAIFSDMTRVKRLYGKGVHNRILPASTTKVMTALLVIEKLDLDSWVTVSSNATLPQPTKLYLKAGEKYRVRDLLDAIMIKSANDAAVVLAEAVAGSHWKFVQLMNKRAREFNMNHTRFANAHGLPSKSKQYSTAYDMYLLFRRAVRHKEFNEVIKKRTAVIYSQAGRKHTLKSHNKMLFFDWKRRIYGKTGYTRAAKACFLGTLQKGKSTLIVGVFGCSRRWDDIKHIVSYYGGIPL